MEAVLCGLTPRRGSSTSSNNAIRGAVSDRGAEPVIGGVWRRPAGASIRVSLMRHARNRFASKLNPGFGRRGKFRSVRLAGLVVQFVISTVCGQRSEYPGELDLRTDIHLLKTARQVGFHGLRRDAQYARRVRSAQAASHQSGDSRFGIRQSEYGLEDRGGRDVASFWIDDQDHDACGVR